MYQMYNGIMIWERYGDYLLDSIVKHCSGNSELNSSTISECSLSCLVLSGAAYPAVPKFGANPTFEMFESHKMPSLFKFESHTHPRIRLVLSLLKVLRICLQDCL